MATMGDRLLSEVGDPNDTADLNAVMVTALMVLLFVFLVVMLYVAHFVAIKCCPNYPVAERSIPGGDARNNPQTTPSLPFSSKVRKDYLETRLKFELFRADGGQTDRDIEKGMIANHVVDNCRINESHWKCTKSLNTCSSAVTDSDSNNQSSSDDDDDEEDHASNDDYDEHNVTNEKSMQEIDGIHECWPDEDGNTAMQCLICFESYVDGDELVRHCSSKKSFHRSCIIVWLLRNDNCPYCRSPILNLSTPSGIDEQ